MNDTLRIDPRQPGADRQMMMTPDYWLLGPVLALQNDDGRLGIMISQPGHPRWRVWDVNLYDERLRPLLQGRTVGDLVCYDYDGVDAVLEAGWKVN